LNWSTLRNITYTQVGRFLALMLVAWSPFMGGPRTPSLLLAGMGGWLLWTRRASLIDSVALRRWSWVFLLLWVPVTLSVLGSVDWQRSASIAAVMVLYFLAGVALVQVLRADADRAWLAKWIAVVLVVWVADGLIQFAVGKDLLLIPRSDDGRIVGLFATNLRLSLFLAILLPLLLWQGLRWHMLWTLLFFCATSLVVLMGGSRSTIVWLVLAAAGIYGQMTSRYKRPVMALLLVAITVFVSFSSVMHERFARLTTDGGLTFEKVDFFLSHRLMLWETAAEMFKARPLTGVGIGTFADNYDKYSARPDDVFRSHGENTSERPYHAHQMYVSMAAETGALGLGGVMAIYALFMYWYFRAPRERRAAAWPYAFSLFSATFPINSQPVLFTHWWFPVLQLLTCATLAALTRDGRRTGTTQASEMRAAA
jgi:O-antigen ligase